MEDLRWWKNRFAFSSLTILHATHTVVLYKYLKEHGQTLGLGQGRNNSRLAGYEDLNEKSHY